MRYIRPMQRISASKKNKEWEKQNVDYWCSQSSEYFTKEWDRMKENYLLHNNVIDQQRFEAICDPLGLDDRLEIEYVQPFNKLPNKINVLIGEELKRPLLYSVVQTNPEATNDILRAREHELKEYIKEFIQKEKEKLLAEQANEMSPMPAQPGQNPGQPQPGMPGMPPQGPPQPGMGQQPQQPQEPTEEEKSFESIEKKYKNYKTQKESLLQQLLKFFLDRSDFRHKKNQGMYHALIAGLEAVHIYLQKGELKVEVVNPLGLFYHKSPEVQFIQEGDAVGYVREMSPGEVLDRWGSVLTDSELKTLIPYAGRVNEFDKMASSKGRSVKHFEHRSNKGRLLYDSDPEFLGSYGQSSMDNEYLKVHTVYWRSFKKVGFLKFENEYGDEELVFVDENFEIPKYAEKVEFQNKFFEKKFKYEWDEYSLEWDWVPQIWEGTRIEDSVYVNVRPLPWQKVNINDPYYAPLPIFGAPYNNRNAPIVSLFDRGKYWQYLYFAIMHKWIKLIMQDKGILHTLNTAMFDKDLPIEMALKYAMEIGVLPYNPQVSFDTLGGQHNTQKVVETANLSNPNVERYTNILAFVDNQIAEAMGVSKQREGQIGQYSTATDTRQAIIQSNHITEPEFKLHNEIWEKVAVYVTKVLPFITDSSKIRTMLNDAQTAILDLDLIDPTDEFDLKVEDSARSYENLNILKQHAQAIIQNDENALEYLVSILESESLPEIKLAVNNIRVELEKRMEAQRQHEQQMQQQQMEAQKQMMQEEKAHEIELAKIKGEYQLKAKEIDVFKFQETLDADNNGIPDPLELEKFKMQSGATDHKKTMDERGMDLKEKELQLKEKALDKKPTKQ